MSRVSRRPLPPEQLAATEERRARFRAIAKQIADMEESQRAELAARIGAVTIEGRPLSVHNACLLAIQNPAVTVVGGFNQWRTAGRIVRKGQHGLMIWAPAKPRAASIADTAAPETASTPEKQSFIPVTVFDITQTEEAQC